MCMMLVGVDVKMGVLCVCLLCCGMWCWGGWWYCLVE